MRKTGSCSAADGDITSLLCFERAQDSTEPLRAGLQTARDDDQASPLQRVRPRDMHVAVIPRKSPRVSHAPRPSTTIRHGFDIIPPNSDAAADRLPKHPDIGRA